MILLDTHVWIKWVSGDPGLAPSHLQAIGQGEQTGMGISVISCWEVAMLVSLGRLKLTLPLLSWVQQAIAYPGVRLVDLSPRIAVASTELPDVFHKDPADRIIVATARELACPLLTSDQRILDYRHVQTLGPTAKAG